MQLHHLDAQALHLRLLRAVAAQMVDIQPVFFNMHFRDPIIYRIIKTPHHRTGKTWNVYPMYDFAHGQSDYFEGVTHSLCTLEFEVHRPLYDYFIDLLIDSECGKGGDYRP